MKFLIGLVVGAILAAAIGAGALAVAFGELDGAKSTDRDTSADIAQAYDLTDFDRISVTGVYELEVEIGDSYSVDITGPARELERVQAKVEGGVLTLGTKDRVGGGKLRLHKDSVTAKITMPAINGIDVAGVVDGEIRGVKAERFRASLSGVGDLDIVGECVDLDLTVSGVGDLDAEDFVCENVQVSVSGVGSATVYASQSVNANVTGMGNIKVYGSPANVEKSGGMFSNVTIK